MVDYSSFLCSLINFIYYVKLAQSKGSFYVFLPVASFDNIDIFNSVGLFVIKSEWDGVVQAFNPSVWEAEACRSLSSWSAWSIYQVLSQPEQKIEQQIDWQGILPHKPI